MGNTPTIMRHAMQFPLPRRRESTTRMLFADDYLAPY